jgi:hypothetical protein
MRFDANPRQEFSARSFTGMFENNFDALLDDLAAVQKLKDAGRLQKALAQADAFLGKRPDEVRAARAQAARPAAPKPVMLQQIGPDAPRPSTKRAPTKAEMRRRFEAGRGQILAKAMSLLAAGEISATQVAAVEARLNRMGAGL